MLHRLLVLPALLMAVLPVTAQMPDSASAPVVAYGQAAIGGLGSTFSPLTIAELRAITKDSRILGQDLSGHRERVPLQGYGSASIAMDLGLVLGRRVVEGRRRGPELRLGYMFVPGTITNTGWSRTDRAVYDTLTSAVTGQAYPVDSVRTSTITAGLRASFIAFDASLLFRTRNPDRVTFFGGIGAFGGAAFNSEVVVEEHIDRSLESASGHGELAYQELADEDRSERHAQTDGAWYGGYIPLGIDLRLGRRRGFWRMVHLYHELRPMVTFRDLPGVGVRGGVGLQGLFGLRIDTSY